MFSSKTSEWETPQEFFEYWDDIYYFTLDPCCTKETAKCKKFYTKEDDGLSKSWAGERVFMNPPYGREIGNWIKKAWIETEYNENTFVLALIPARTDTKWWHNYCMYAERVYFIKGRLKFTKWYMYEGMYIPDILINNSAGFPSAIVVFSKGFMPPSFDSFDWRNEI